MRLLFEWQGVTRQPKPECVESLAAVITQLEGYEVPAAAWESDVLAARLNEYDPHWLDSLCLSGRALWARLTPAKSTTADVRDSPRLILRTATYSWVSTGISGGTSESAGTPSDESRTSPIRWSVSLPVNGVTGSVR